jgi:glycosyltransferase involved in cell wall biosynthesis
MKVVILCHNLYVGGGLNVGLNFVRTLKEVASEHKFLIVAAPRAGYESVDLPAGSDVYIYQGGRNLFNRWRFDCHKLPALVKDWWADVVLGLGNLGITQRICKQALLFADSHLIYPARHYRRETYKARLSKWLMAQRMIRCLKYTDLVFCQTPVTKKRFSQSFNYPIDRVKIMSKAVSEFSKISRASAGIPELFLGGKYYNLFYLTKFYAHKNIEILIEVFKKYRERLKDVRCIVTIAADHHPNARRFLNDIKKYNLRDHIINVGPLKEDQLAGYFYNSDALFFPSLLESFSSTHLEAMHFGLPILTSDLDFSRYSCDDAAFYFDPWNTDDIADKILMLKNNNALAAELAEKGKKRLSLFFRSWSEIVAETIKELELLTKQK